MCIYIYIYIYIILCYIWVPDPRAGAAAPREAAAPGFEPCALEQLGTLILQAQRGDCASHAALPTRYWANAKGPSRGPADSS